MPDGNITNPILIELELALKLDSNNIIVQLSESIQSLPQETGGLIRNFCLTLTRSPFFNSLFLLDISRLLFV